MSILSHIFNLLPIKKEKVVLYSAAGVYADSPKYIARAILRHKTPCNLVWVSKDKLANTPRAIRPVKGRYSMYYHLSTARVIISDTRLGKYWMKGFIKKPGQIYYQTEGEGSLSPKKLGADEHTIDVVRLERDKLDAHKIDYLLSGSSWLTETYASCSHFHRTASEWGNPRNDVLCKPNEKHLAKVRKKLKIADGVKIALYAPTKRDWAKAAFTPPNYKKVISALSERFGGKWILLIRRYPRASKYNMNWIMPKKSISGVRDVTNFPDTPELLALADALISDYSSCLYDYMLTRKPAFVYAADHSKYAKKIGFYYPLEQAPFGVAYSNAELLERIREFDQDEYEKRIDQFLSDKNIIHHGKASDKVAAHIAKALKKQVPPMAPVRRKIIRGWWKKIKSAIYMAKNIDVDYREHRILGLGIMTRRKAEQIPNPYEALPIEENKIFFNGTFNGYTCNNKYIVEEILRQNLPYKMVWCLGEGGYRKNILKYLHSYPDKLKLVVFGTEEAARECSTARVWVDTANRAPFYKKGIWKREGQHSIQIWHGSFGIKKAILTMNPDLKKWAVLAASDIDYLISNSTYESENYHKPHFWYKGYKKGKILEYGHPRNDLLFHPDKDEIRKRVLSKLGIAPEKKLVLYAPTWRNNGDINWISLDLVSLKPAFEKRFGGEFVMAARMHNLLYQYRDRIIPENSDVLNLSEYIDTQELLIAADAFISDYSSCICDYMLLRRPAFLYVPDHRKYANGRQVTYPLTDMPFPIAEDNESMRKVVEEFDDTAYQKAVDDFWLKMGCIEDGHAAARVVDLIQKLAPINKA